MTSTATTQPQPAVTPARATTLFHALSDDTRLEIVRRLHDGEQCVCELTGVLDAAQSRLSFHLRVLKDAGLVHDRRDGRWVHYHLNRRAFDEVQRLVAALMPTTRSLPVQRLGCC